MFEIIDFLGLTDLIASLIIEVFLMGLMSTKKAQPSVAAPSWAIKTPRHRNEVRSLCILTLDQRSVNQRPDILGEGWGWSGFLILISRR